MDSIRAQLPKLLSTILNSFIDLCECDGGSIFTLRKDAEGVEYLAFETMATRSIKLYRVPDHLKDLRFRVDDQTSLVSRTATARKVMKVSFQEGKKGLSPKVDNILKYETRNIISAPLVTPRGELLGVVQLVNKLPYRKKSVGDQNLLYPEFDERDERLLRVVAGQAALAIENSLLLVEQENLLEGFVNACVTAIEGRDPVTSGHSNRVSDYTVALTEAVTRTRTGPLKDIVFDSNQIREIRYAAMLHDVGKIAVKEEVLNKEKKLMPYELEIIRMRLKLMKATLLLRQQIERQDMRPLIEKLNLAWKVIADANEPNVLPMKVSEVLSELKLIQVQSEEGEIFRALTENEGFKLAIPRGSLTDVERLAIESHVTHTYEILKRVPWSRGLKNVPDIAYKHHEKLDGSGYPRHTLGSEISVQTRMLTVCDIYDALTADDRPYKPAIPLERALDILGREVKSAKLDKELFQVFLDARIFDIGRIKKTEKKAA